MVLRREQQTIALLPCLDCRSYLHGSEVDKRLFASELRSSFERHGFVKLINHGVPDTTIAEMFTQAQRLFCLPASMKMHFAHEPGPHPQRGWSRLGSENAAKLYAALHTPDRSVDVVDSREHFDLGCPSDDEFPNRWPSEADLPGFRQLSESAYSALQRASKMIMEALEMAFDLRGGSLTSRCCNGADELRRNHYPAVDVGEINKGKINRIWPHTDLGVITCLFQDDIGGLEIEDRGNLGSFLPVVRGNPAEMVVNVSETLERWTNGHLRAGVHQVTVPAYLKHADKGLVPARVSIPYFVKADRRASAGPLTEFVVASGVARYEEMSALEYHMQRVAKAY